MPGDSYKNLIIGSGEGGKSLAWHLGRLGEKTILVEKKMIGGSCPNIACLPSKNVVYSAKAVSLFSRAAEFGVSINHLTLDIAGVIRRKREMVDGLVRMHLDKFKATGVELLMGEAKFIGPRTVRVDANDGSVRTLTADHVFLSVGSRASIPRVPGLAESKPLTHVEALELDHLPEHLVVLGGGYVGLEFAQAMRRFGSRVTIVQHGPRLLDKEDPDVSDAIAELLKDEGIDVRLHAELTSATGTSGQNVKLTLKDGTINATDILVATGRTPNNDRIDADKGGVELTHSGHIKVDDKLRTSAPDVWAIGDCAGSPHFTHVAYDDFRIIRDTLAGGNRSTLNRLIPYVLFTDPELAHVGLNETEAKEKGIPYRLFKLPMAGVLRTWTLNEKRGFLKALVGDDDRILGFTAFGVDAGEIMASVQTAMLGGLPYPLMREAIYTHPTIAEGFGPLFSTAPTKH